MEPEFKIGDLVDTEVTRITDFGAFVKINGQTQGLIHISQIADSFVKDINQHLKVGERLKARVLKIGPGKKIDLSLKKNLAPRAERKQAVFSNRGAGFKSSDFEEKLKRFLKDSQHNLNDLKRHNEKFYK